MSGEHQQPDSVIGVDLDNTLVTYDNLFHQLATERGLIGLEVPATKKTVRDAVRLMNDGEIEWQKLQALAYGPMMVEASMTHGSRAFLQKCLRRNVKVIVISHKTEFANYDETGTNLRFAALEWMERNQFFDGSTYGLSRSDVHFETTREAKLIRIENLGCTHFIDDLEETFLEKSFPSNVERILYSSQPGLTSAEVELAADWPQITSYFFHD